MTDPLGAGLRDKRRTARFGKGAVCIECGEDNLAALHVVEGHHVAGRNNDPDLTVPICLNCHAIAHEDLRTAGVPMVSPVLTNRTSIDRLELVLRAVATFLSSLSEHVHRWADQVGNLVGWLDHSQPAWRADFLAHQDAATRQLFTIEDGN